MMLRKAGAAEDGNAWPDEMEISKPTNEFAKDAKGEKQFTAA
jgi:hypothetical protein